MLPTWILSSLLPLLVILQVSSSLPLNPQNGHAHNRTAREQDCYEEEYEHKGICCRSCLAGSYVAAHCTANHHRGTCKSCTAGQDYTAYSNGMESCLPCLTCTEDKVLVQRCTPESNAKCECKPGSYCTPEEPCEICNRCSRCREGQRVKKPCTSTTDTVCEDVSAPESTSTKANVNGKETVFVPTSPPKDVTGKKAVPVSTSSFKDKTEIKEVPTEPPDDPAGSRTYLYFVLPLTATGILVIAIAGFFLYKRKTKDNSENNLINTPQGTSVSASLSSIQSEGKDSKEEVRCQELQHLMSAPLQEPKKVEKQINLNAVPYERVAQGEPVENNSAEPPEGDVENEERMRVQCDCDSPRPCDHDWVDFNYTVIDSIPQSRMHELVRKLRLNKATMEQILKDYSNNCREQNFNLLYEWRYRKGTQASMRTVIRVLDEMDLGGCSENIENSLRIKGIPMN